MFETQKDLATKVVYVAIGAPVVATRAVREYGTKIAGGAQAQFAEFADEGEKTAKKLQGGNVVEELQSRVDLEKVQDRVEKLRDQLEGALQSWRESFTPTDTKAPARKVTVEGADETKATKPAAAKTTATKITTTKTTAATKTAAAKKAPAKTTTTRTRKTTTSAAN